MDNKILNNEEASPKWYIKHKKVLIISGVVLVGTAAIIAYVLLRKKMVSANEIANAVNLFSTESIKPVSEITNNLIERAQPVSVSSYLRKLPEGWHASETQLKLAESLGWIVPDGHTLVSEHTRYNHLPDCA